MSVLPCNMASVSASFSIMVLALSAISKVYPVQTADRKLNDVSADEKTDQHSKSSVPSNFGGGLFQKSPVLRKDLSTLSLVMNAEKVSQYLRGLANSELGVLAMQVRMLVFVKLLCCSTCTYLPTCFYWNCLLFV